MPLDVSVLSAAGRGGFRADGFALGGREQNPAPAFSAAFRGSGTLISPVARWGEGSQMQAWVIQSLQRAAWFNEQSFPGTWKATQKKKVFAGRKGSSRGVTTQRAKGVNVEMQRNKRGVRNGQH